MKLRVQKTSVDWASIKPGDVVLHHGKYLMMLREDYEHRFVNQDTADNFYLLVDLQSGELHAALKSGNLEFEFVDAVVDIERGGRPCSNIEKRADLLSY